MQPDELIAQFQERISLLEQENTRLRARFELALLSRQSYQEASLESCELAQANQQLNRSDLALEHHLLEATAKAVNALLTIAPFDAAVNTALQIIGETLETDRVKILECVFDEPANPYPTDYTMSYEWITAGTRSQLDHPGSSRISNAGAEAFMAENVFHKGGFGGLLQEWPEVFWSAFEAVQAKGSYCVPIQVEGQLWGVLVYDDCHQVKHRHRRELAGLKIAANCIGSAIQREHTQQALLQAEQRRAAELAKANEALKRSLDVLSTDPDLNRFLGHVLKVIAQELDAPVVEHWWHHESDNIAYLNLSCCWGELLTPAQQARDPRVQGVRIPPGLVDNQSLHHRQQHCLVEDLVSDPVHIAVFHAINFDLASWSAEYGVRKYIQLPLAIGEQNIGTLCIYIPGPRTFSEQQIELSRALAHQVTLAIQLTKLAEEAKQAAITREQEQAAQERAAELSKANEALRNAIAGLARLDSIDQFLAEMLRVVLEISGAQSGGVVLIDGDVLRLPVLFSKQGLVGPQVQEHQGYSCAPFSAELREYAQRILKSEEFWWVSPDDPIHPLSFRTFHQQEGNRAISHVPMQVNNRLLGWLGLGFAEETPPLGRSYALLSVLAEQMTMALEMLRLAEEAKQAAIAREQEQAAQNRAAQLARANQVLQRTVAQLVGQDDLNQFLAYVLLEAAQEAEAANAAIFLYDSQSDTLKMHQAVQDGQVVNLDTDPRFALWQIAVPVSSTPSWKQITQSYAMWIDLNRAQADAWDFSIPWHLQMGHQSVLCVPLLLGQEPLGFLGLCFRDPIRPGAEPIELVQTLAHQATLAIQLTRLAEEAKQAAIVREQEKAASERAAELTKANIALQKTLASLAKTQDVKGFLEATLQEVVRQAGACAGHLFRYESQTNQLQQIVCVRDGVLYPDGHPEEPASFREGFSADITPAYRILVEQRRLIWQTTDKPDENTWPDTVDWHRQMGHTAHAGQALVAGEQPVGSLGLAFRDHTTLTPGQTELIQALAHQMALALELTRLAEEAKQVAIARQQELAATERAAELARANDALQASIDAMAEIEDLDEFIPVVLKIVAQTFQASQTENCAYYEHTTDDRVYLRYWLFQNRVFRPEELLALDGDRFALMRRLAGGFTVPDAYLGTSVRERTQAVILDHLAGTPEPEFDEFTGANGWHMELNVPLVVDGCADGALVVYRKAGGKFTRAEVTLAESLGKQLALAMQANRLAKESKSKAVETAIAREQEKAATERVTQLAKANEVLRQTVDVLATESELNNFLGHVLKVIAQQLDAPLTEYWFHPEPGHVAYLGLSCLRGQILTPREQPGHPGVIGFPVPKEMIRGESLHHRRRHFVIEDATTYAPLVETNAQIGVDTARWCAERGVRKQLNVPLRLGEKTIGALLTWIPSEGHFSEQQIELTYALAQQVTLAIQLTRLAEEAKRAAIVREQEQAATERAAELAKANEALKRSLGALAAEQTLTSFLGHILTSITQQLNAPSSVLWMYDREQRAARLSLVFDGQTIQHPEETNHPNAHVPRDYSHPERAQVWEGMIHQRQCLVLVIAEEHRMTPAQREYLLSQGIWGILSIPMVLGEHTLGVFAVHFSTPRIFPAQELELVQALASQAALAIELTRLADQAKESAILEERNRMAREIHDSLAQCLSGIIVQLQAAEDLYTSNAADRHFHMAQAIDLAELGLSEARRSVRALRPQALENVSLDIALTQLAHRTNTSALQATCDIQGIPYALPTEVESNLLRIAQEALTNCIRHANASLVEIGLIYQPEQVQLRIRDNGRGFNPNLSTPHCYGLIGMRERAAAIGAKLNLSSQVGTGTQVIVVLPILASSN